MALLVKGKTGGAGISTLKPNDICTKFSNFLYLFYT